MSLDDISKSIGQGVGILVIVMGLIQITPLKIDPFGRLFRWIGKNWNAAVTERIDKQMKELSTKIDANEKSITDINAKVDQLRAMDCRMRILQFSDSIMHHELHSEEMFNQILADIKEYEMYCFTHPAFENNRTDLAVKRIKEVYGICLKDDDFL